MTCFAFILAFECTTGCRYNVRETGFVDAGARGLVLVCCIDNDTPVGFGETFLREAEGLLGESTVTYELVNVDDQPEHPALNHLSESSRSTLPALVLVSREGNSFELSISLNGDRYDVLLRSSLLSVVETPFRRRLVENLAEHYGVILLIDGLDEAQNAMALESAQRAVEAIQGQMRYMPKPIQRGPVVMRLEEKLLTNEAFLLWALGVDNEASEAPYGAVVYGKGRLLGPVLQGDEIEEGILVRLLAVVGADCECGLDPRLIRGRPLPIRWNKSLQEVVVKELGFDPENPLVRIEVGHIMRMRESLYPTSVPSRTPGKAEEFPVPFVEDKDPGRLKSFGNDPILKNVIYSLVGLGVLAVAFGLLIMIKARRKSR